MKDWYIFRLINTHFLPSKTVLGFGFWWLLFLLILHIITEEFQSSDKTVCFDEIKYFDRSQLFPFSCVKNYQHLLETETNDENLRIFPGRECPFPA